MHTKDLQITDFICPLVSVEDIPYSPAKITVLSRKLYRTRPQALPYRLARDTVLSDKLYRTAPQNIAYLSTRVAHKVPAKWGKRLGERFERLVVVSC